MGFDKRDSAKKYSPKDGDTLKSIAERETAQGNPITPEDLARYNWGTDDPDVVDEHLRDEMGCYKRAPDKRFMFSDDAEPTGELLIPAAFKKTGLSTDATHTIKVKKKAEPPEQFKGCSRIKGITFEFDKSFVRPSVVGDLEAVEEELQKSPDAQVMIFGHTDKVGSEVYNKDLSERRAKSVYAFITNKPDIWEQLYQQESWGIRAVQEILKDMGGPYDPGPVDGINGSQTQQAVRNFQKDHGLAVDGVAGPNTRQKLFSEYMSGIHDIEIDDSRFMDPKHMGCGEFNPVVDTEEANEANRRVMFYLFDKARLPVLPCKAGDVAPCKKQMTPPAPRHNAPFKCSFYDSIAKKCGSDGPGPVPPKPKDKSLQIVSPTAERLQFINLPEDAANENQGRKVVVKAQVDPPAAGVTVHWAFEEHSALKWATDDKAAFNASGLGASLQAGFKTAGTKTATSTTDGSGVAEIDFLLSRYGGDEYVVGVGFSEADAKDTVGGEKSPKLVVFRRVWYQMTHDEGLTIPDVPNARAAYKRVSSELIATTPKKFKKADAPARTYYPEFMMIPPGGADTEVAVIGSHNKVAFQGNFVPEADKPVKAHLIICEHQWDEGGTTATVNVEIDKSPSGEISMSKSVFKPALSGGLVVTGTWAAADGSASGTLSEADVLLEKGRTSRRRVKVKLPGGAPTPTAAKKVKVKLKLRAADGPFLGESGTPHMLIVLEKSDPVDFQNTVGHEIMHGLNQTVEAGKQPDGLPNHPHQYTGHGGSGSHCNTVLGAGGKHSKGTEATVDGEKVFTTGICAMFHSKDSTCINRFCDVCEPYLRAEDFTTFR